MKKKTRTQINNAANQMKAAMNADIINHVNEIIDECGSVQEAANLLGINAEELDRICHGVNVESVNTLFRILIATDNSMMIVPLGGHMPMPIGGMPCPSRMPRPNGRAPQMGVELPRMGGPRVPKPNFSDFPIPPMGDMPNIPNTMPQAEDVDDEGINEMPNFDKPLDAMSRRELVDIISNNFNTANLDLVNMTRSEMIDLLSREQSIENGLNDDTPTKEDIMDFISNELDSKSELYDMIAQFLTKKNGSSKRR